MPSQQYINPEALSRSRGYSQVVKVGNTVYIAGQISAGPDGTVVGKGDPESQARQVWRNIEAAVKAAGGTLQNVVKTTTYVTNIQYATAVRKVREELFQSSNPPTSTLLVVAGLASPDYMVEIEAIAVVD
ncbi:MAG: RidA family protein [Candidatus Tectomicrobia bacterium]|jgi:reactive intermediate/imine deaminase|nr:RidA family protein [Candidatus Tectomicrobia bacterium]